jgi:hypothetical protein
MNLRHYCGILQVTRVDAILQVTLVQPSGRDFKGHVVGSQIAIRFQWVFDEFAEIEASLETAGIQAK